MLVLAILALILIFTLLDKTEGFSEPEPIVENNVGLCLACLRGDFEKCPDPRSIQVLTMCK